MIITIIIIITTITTIIIIIIGLKVGGPLWRGSVRPIFELKLVWICLTQTPNSKILNTKIGRNMCCSRNLIALRNVWYVRPIFELRISDFGIWVKQILKRRRWAFLAHRLIS